MCVCACTTDATLKNIFDLMKPRGISRICNKVIYVCGGGECFDWNNAKLLERVWNGNIRAANASRANNIYVTFHVTFASSSSWCVVASCQFSCWTNTYPVTALTKSKRCVCAELYWWNSCCWCTVHICEMEAVVETDATTTPEHCL